MEPGGEVDRGHAAAAQLTLDTVAVREGRLQALELFVSHGFGSCSGRV